MKSSEGIVPLLALYSEIIGGLAVVFGLVKWIASWFRPIKVKGQLSADHLKVLVKVKARRSDSVLIPDAGISVPKRRFGVQIKRVFLGFKVGKEPLTFVPRDGTTVSRKDGWSAVAEQPLTRVREAAAKTGKTLTPPIRPYARHNNSRMTAGRRIRLTK